MTLIWLGKAPWLYYYHLDVNRYFKSSVSIEFDLSKHTNLPVILRVNDEEELDKEMVKRYAKLVKLK